MRWERKRAVKRKRDEEWWVEYWQSYDEEKGKERIKKEVLKVEKERIEKLRQIEWSRVEETRKKMRLEERGRKEERISIKEEMWVKGGATMSIEDAGSSFDCKVIDEDRSAGEV